MKREAGCGSAPASPVVRRPCRGPGRRRSARPGRRWPGRRGRGRRPPVRGRCSRGSRWPSGSSRCRSTGPAGSKRVKTKASTNSSSGTPYCRPMRDRDGEVVHQRAEGGAFLVHVDEDLAELAVVVFAGVQIDLVAADGGLLDVALAAVGQLAAASGRTRRSARRSAPVRRLRRALARRRRRAGAGRSSAKAAGAAARDQRQGAHAGRRGLGEQREGRRRAPRRTAAPASRSRGAQANGSTRAVIARRGASPISAAPAQAPASDGRQAGQALSGRRAQGVGLGGARCRPAAKPARARMSKPGSASASSGRAQHVADEALADHRRREGAAQAGAPAAGPPRRRRSRGR